MPEDDTRYRNGLPKDIWRGVRKERERRAGVDAGEAGKSWNDTFAPRGCRICPGQF